MIIWTGSDTEYFGRIIVINSIKNAYKYLQSSSNSKINYRDLFDYIVENMSNILTKRDEDILRKIILRSCEIKSEVVSKDVNENDLRMILNFGHTIGHGLEAYFEYKTLLHGEAIIYGMKCALHLSHTIGSLNHEEYRLGLKALLSFTLPSIDIKEKKEFSRAFFVS